MLTIIYVFPKSVLPNELLSAIRVLRFISSKVYAKDITSELSLATNSDSTELEERTVVNTYRLCHDHIRHRHFEYINLLTVHDAAATLSSFNGSLD